MPRAELNDEHYRILRAARDERLGVNVAGRWVIAGEPRPDRRSREQLHARGLIGYGFHGTASVTDKGLEALGATR